MSDKQLPESKKPQPVDILKAIECLDIDLVKQLIADKADLSIANKDGELPLNVAARMGGPKALAIMETLIEVKAPIDGPRVPSLTSICLLGFPPLFTAIRSGKKDMVRCLLNWGADCDIWWMGETPLLSAITYADTEIVDILLKAGAQITKSCWSEAILQDHGRKLEILLRQQTGSYDLSIFTFFEEAAKKGHANVVRVLLKAGIVKTDQVHKVLESACARGHVGVVRVLLEEKTSVKNMAGRAPLISACEHGQYEVARILVEKKADIRSTATDRGAHAALDRALTSAGKHLYHILQLFPQDLRPDPDRLYLALLEALNSTGLQGEKQMSQLKGLLSVGARVDYGPAGQASVWECARRLRLDQPILDLLEDAPRKEKAVAFFAGLFKKPAAVKKKEVKKRAAEVQLIYDSPPQNIFKAIEQLDVNSLRLLLEAKADPNRTLYDASALMSAMLCPDREAEAMVRLLLNAKANLAYRMAGDTALDRAVRRGRVATVQALVEARAGLEDSHLQQAIGKDDPKMIRKLLNLMASSKKDSKEDSPFLCAARLGKVAALKVLVEAKADPKAAAFYSGNAAFHVAISNLKSDDSPPLALLTELAKAKADVEAVNREGKTPLEMAMDSGNIPLIKALVRLKASPMAKLSCGKSAFELARLGKPRKIVETLEELAGDPWLILGMGEEAPSPAIMPKGSLAASFGQRGLFDPQVLRIAMKLAGIAAPNTKEQGPGPSPGS